MSNLNNAPWAKYGEVPQTEDGEDSKSTTSSSRSAARDIVRSMNQQRYTDLHTQGFVDEGIVTAPVSVSSSSSTVLDERQAFLRNANVNSDYMYDDDHRGSSSNRENVDSGIVIGADDPSDGDDNLDGGSNSNQEGPTTPRNRNWLKLGGIIGVVLVLIVGVVIALYFTVINKPSAAPKSVPLPPSNAPSSPILGPSINATLAPTLVPINETNATLAPTLVPINETNATLAPSWSQINTTNATLAPTLVPMNGTNATLAPSLAPTAGNMTNLTTMPPISTMNETNVTNSSFTQDDWQQQDTNIDTLLPSLPGDLSGFSVSLSGSGSRLAIGSPGTDSDGGTKSGVMTIVEDTGNGTWTKVETLMGTAPGEQLGISVALSKDGNFVVVGSLKTEGTDSEGKGGSVRVYEIMASSTAERNMQFRQLSNLIDDDFLLTYSVSALLRGLQENSSKKNATFDDALLQAAEAAGIKFEGNVTAYAEALKGVITNITESGKFSSIIDGNVTFSPEDVLSLAGTLSDPSTVANAGGSILSDSNTSSTVPSMTNVSVDFASMLSDAATSQGISFNGSDLAAYIEQLTTLVQTVANSNNVTTITDGNTVISTTDFINLADSFQNSSAAIEIYPSNETVLLPPNETLSNETLKQLGKTLYLEASTKEDYFGYSLSISSNGAQIAMGAPATNGNAGNIYVYRFDETVSDWKPMNVESSSKKDDFLGWSVAMSGDGSTLAAGAPYRTNKKPGYVNLYTMQGDTWTISKTFTPDNLTDNMETDDFGFSVALDNNGRTLVIGSPNSTLLGGRIMNPPGQKRKKAEPATGYVIVYGLDETLTEWSQMGDVLVGEQPGGQFGYSVSVSESGTRIVAGAPNLNAGYVCVYNFDELAKQWEIAPTIVGTDSGGDTGHSVSISSNGLQLSIGSPSQTQCREGNDVCKHGTVLVFQDPTSVATSTRITSNMKYY